MCSVKQQNCPIISRGIDPSSGRKWRRLIRFEVVKWSRDWAAQRAPFFLSKPRNRPELDSSELLTIADGIIKRIPAMWLRLQFRLKQLLFITIERHFVQLTQAFGIFEAKKSF